MGIIEKLETMVRGTGTLVRGAAYTGVALASSLGMTYRANAETIPADFFATTDAKKIELADYDSVVTTSNWGNYYGNIKWDDPTKTSVTVGYRVWGLDDDKKPCSLYDIASPSPGVGKWGLSHFYEDDSTTLNTDEGANNGDVIIPLVEEISTGKMYNAWFVDASYNPISITFSGDKLSHKADILVDTNPIIPEPSGLALIITSALTAGAGLGIRRRLRK